MFCRRSTTRALAPTGTRCGSSERVQASLYRLRPTYAAASSGSAASSTATRSRSFSPRMNAEMAAAAAGGEEGAAARGQPAQRLPHRQRLRDSYCGAAVAGCGRVSYGERLPVVRQRQPVHDVGDDRVGGAPGQLRVGGRDDAVGEHRHGQRLQVVGQDVVAALERGDRAGGAQQLQGGPGRGAEAQVGRLAGGGDQVDRVLLDGVGDVHVADGGDQPAHDGRVGDRRAGRRSGSWRAVARRAWPARRAASG